MIDKEQVKHVASLARLSLKEEEVEKMSKDLSAVLDYFEQLQEVDTSSIDPTLNASASENVFREDKVTSKASEENTKKLLELAPENEDGYIKVRSILK